MKQKLSIKARKAKAKRDKLFAMTLGRKAKKAENQRLRRKAKKKGISLINKDYDHTKKKFVSVKKNRGNYGKGTKK